MEGYWKIYFETNNQSATEFLTKFSESCEKAIWYLHPAEDSKTKKREHIHGLIKDCRFIDDTARNHIKKAFSLGQKGHKNEFAVSNTYERGTRMSEENVSKYITYMTKGKYEPILNKGFENIEELKSNWKNPNVITIELVQSKEKKMTLYKIARAAQQEYMSEFVEEGRLEELQEDLNTSDSCVNWSKMAKVVISLLKQNHILAHKRTVIQVLQDIRSDMCPKRFIGEVIRCL